jgi:hypothetical protein
VFIKIRYESAERINEMINFFRFALAILLLASYCGCDKKSEEKPTTEPVAAEQQPDADKPAPAPQVKITEDTSGGLCDGEIDVADIPAGALTGIIAGKKLEPNQSIVKASQFMKQVSFDFNLVKSVDPDKICFAGGAQIHAAATFKTGNMAVAPGTYKFKAGAEDAEDWTAWYSYVMSGGSPNSVNTLAYYGVVVIDSFNLGTRPAELFAPAGKASGKLLICFGDETNSWIGGSFTDIPVCQ